MTLRTPRRRISPRTKRRYRAVKNFLRKALGTPSQGDLGTNSSVEPSVSDLQNKLQGLEQQLNKVSKHCQDLASLEEKVRKESVKLLTQEDFAIETLNKPSKSDKHLNCEETKQLYNYSNQDQNHDKSCKALNDKNHAGRNDMISYEPTCSKNFSDLQFKTKRSKCRKSNEYFNEHTKNIKRRHNTREPAQSKCSFHSLIVPKNKENCSHGFSGHGPEKRRKGYVEADLSSKYKDRENNQKYVTYNDKKYERQETSRRKKRYTEVDKEFIADIINRQYKPVKLFSKTHSDFSQFSAPVCRDQEHRIREEIQEGSALCSCCFDEGRRLKHRYVRNSDVSDMRSICDTRLYSSKRHRNHKDIRRYTEDYNNSAFYDIVPVKEKSSPKSRRKFAEDNIMSYHCREVPPSPRSQRPRLNLKVQNYSDYEDAFRNKKDHSYKNSPIRQKYNRYESDFSESAGCGADNRQAECFLNMKTHKAAQVQEEVGTTSSLQVPILPDEQINVSNNDTTLNTQVTDLAADKTDKTLGEIKEILQSFLLEIKKDSAHDKESNTTSNKNSAIIDDKTTNEDTEKNKANTNTLQNNGHNWNYNTGPCSAPGFLPPFANPCCYPIIPICPMNCLQNGYIMPNPSFTCTACARNSKDNTCLERDCCNTKINASQEMKTSDDTQELIKEIYKFVTQNSKPHRKRDDCFNENNANNSKNGQRILDKKLLTNRSVGGSTKTFKHDANVGTPNMKCYSKSCEAIGSRIPSDTYNTTNSSLSETVLEKLSLEATQSSTESDVTTDVPEEKVKRSKFQKLLRSLRIIKKKKDVIEEVSESESTVNVNVKQNHPPFRQHIMSYAMHEQEYFKPPPIPDHHCCRPHLHDHSHDYNQRMLYPPYIRDEFYYNTPSMPSHPNPAKYSRPPLCPNHDPRYNQVQQPQVPLCLKEIEVKSIGTQSVRKMSIFHKLANKVQQPVQQNGGQQYSAPPIRKKPTLWQSLQEKAKQQSTDPLDFSLKTQKQLAQGDIKMRNAMLKKLFYKRNPFSPRNLIVKTLLGKDKSSFGDPPKMYRPRMFL